MAFINSKRYGNKYKNIWITCSEICIYQKYGIYLHNILKHNIMKPKYTKNENYFSVIDSADKAYWLGALYADGCVRNDKNVFFTSKDKDWVLDFLKAIEYTGKPLRELHKVYKTECWKANITSKIMFKDLVNNGCVPNKSLILEFPKLNDSLIPHFIRGYFDGDGSVGEYKTSNKSEYKALRSSICSGSKKFLDELVKYLPIKYMNVRKNKNGVYSISMSVKNSISFANYIYKDANIFLKRKKDIFDNAIQRRSETIIANPKSKTKEYARNYYHAHKERMKELRDKNRDKKIEYMREYNKRPEVMARRKLRNRIKE